MMQKARDKLRELRALHDDGLLSEQEFEHRKNAILDAEYAPPGASAPAPLPVRQGTELGLMAGQEIGPQNRRYRLERLIGTGGMGQVWQATDLATHAELGSSEMVALKILPPQLTQSPTHARLLIEEATQARKLAHEHIVRVYEWAQDPATASYFIIMECLDGEDLEHYLAREGRLTLPAVQQLLAPVAEALSYAWEKHKLVHRDIKPGNVFLTAGGEVKLLDYGIASRVRNAGSSIGLETPNAGTDGYRAPEAGAYQRQPSPRLDVYAVSVMIYQMLEGRMPFDEVRQAGHLPSAPQALNATQWQVLQNGFSMTPELRAQSVQALLESLERAAGPTAEELLEQARQERAREAQRQQQAALEAQQAREAARKLEEEQAQRRQAEAHAAALEKQRLDKVRREQEAQRQREADEARKLRKEALRGQLRARREADAASALLAHQELQRKAVQAKAEAAYRAEQERARREAAEKAQASRAASPVEPSPEASPEASAAPVTAPASIPAADGLLRDDFLDGSGQGPELVLIPSGRFQMGSNEEEHKAAMRAGAQKSWLEREMPQHWVGIAQPFALARHPVSVGEWRVFVRATGWNGGLETNWEKPGFVQTDLHPVVGVSWNDAQLYLAWLGEKTGQRYRLPSEAEWEYACRAGSRTAFHTGETISTEQANYDGLYIYNGGERGQYRGGTTAQGVFAPNAWGLYDMHGNVWEWVQDSVHDNYQGAPVDGSAWEDGADSSRRILRGGSWLYHPRYLRSALRNGYSAVLSNDIVGFRVAREVG
ncbi:bifunctional serine/threonine-protein kinase/formylglycine-generating enzyme family protein [Janthinobacterium aquaticum]|uniref:bifunctional serine/threonine-protein kinase/formylglycine-generating enzyme family protein n=1 Tax=Janthinobacterium sp. FT58W TaxID=2654254 RepID=UPI001263F0D6|nr:bifunctional serine/threonine-protein kinase/formylglycine-generating enzyme family protein [Janthinobacterium sp. FT58W]KAB8045069.1 SUMF1/EgtB/PvdO family nonheme iron enzyme [Janthinobacterium sp. FT58W]